MPLNSSSPGQPKSLGLAPVAIITVFAWYSALSVTTFFIFPSSSSFVTVSALVSAPNSSACLFILAVISGPVGCSIEPG